jgi:probable rRNA maturation factor
MKKSDIKIKTSLEIHMDENHVEMPGENVINNLFYHILGSEIQRQNKYLNENLFKLKNIKKPNKEYSFFLNLYIINDDEMLTFNKLYRYIDDTTDVLSFSALENLNFEIFFGMLDYDFHLGDIIINWNRLKLQATNENHSLESEFWKLFTHGLMHLLGYNDEKSEMEWKTMQNAEELYINSLIRVKTETD